VSVPARPVLAFDFGSAVASAALALDGRLIAVVERERGRGEEAELLPLLDELLRGAGLRPAGLGGVVAVCGPGSFTGVRVACATALALAQARALPATGVPTLEALALTAPPEKRRVVCVVDALRGEWFVERFARGAMGELESVQLPAIRRAEECSFEGDELAIGPDASRFLAGAAITLPSATGRPLAAAVAPAASRGRWPWELAPLLRPHHLRAPAVTLR